MALFKISKGVKANLPSTKTEGYCWFTTDDGKFYIDVSNSVRQVLNAGHADTAAKLSTARTISLTGDVIGSGSFDGSEDLNIAVTVKHTITANADDDNVIVLSSESGENSVTYSASHAKKGPSSGYTSGNTVTSIGDSGISNIIKIPQLTIDAYGHVTAASDEQIDIKIPDTSTFLKKTGDTMTGYLALTENVGYGTSLPTNPVEGQIFFISEEDGEISSLPNGGTAGQYLIKQSDEDGDAAWGNLPSLNYLPLTGGTLTGDLFGTNATFDKVYGAVWNDYAEYRICKEDFKAGQVVCENNDDTLSISSSRLQPGANIVSDTFGFAIGETQEAKCPIAVSGRVLAYPYESRDMFNAGDAVCAGPNGTVSLMTREEIREYPERIIGTVSAVPNYEFWGENNIKVNNRIWIKVR